MHWIRGKARRFAAATLLVLVALTGVTSLAHGFACHEDECALAVVPHDSASHSVASGGTAAGSGPFHCVLCHWTRSTRPSPEPRVIFARPAGGNVLLHVTTLGLPSPVQAAQPSLRSPPFA